MKWLANDADVLRVKAVTTHSKLKVSELEDNQNKSIHVGPVLDLGQVSIYGMQNVH